MSFLGSTVFPHCDFLPSGGCCRFSEGRHQFLSLCLPPPQRFSDMGHYRPQAQVQHSSMRSCSRLYSFFLITLKPVLSVRDWLKPGTKGELAELNNPWILGQGVSPGAARGQLEGGHQAGVGGQLPHAVAALALLYADVQQRPSQAARRCRPGAVVLCHLAHQLTRHQQARGPPRGPVGPGPGSPAAAASGWHTGAHPRDR